MVRRERGRRTGRDVMGTVQIGSRGRGCLSPISERSSAAFEFEYAFEHEGARVSRPVNVRQRGLAPPLPPRRAWRTRTAGACIRRSAVSCARPCPAAAVASVEQSTLAARDGAGPVHHEEHEWHEGVAGQTRQGSRSTGTSTLIRSPVLMPHDGMDLDDISDHTLTRSDLTCSALRPLCPLCQFFRMQGMHARRGQRFMHAFVSFVLFVVHSSAFGVRPPDWTPRLTHANGASSLPAYVRRPVNAQCSRWSQTGSPRRTRRSRRGRGEDKAGTPLDWNEHTHSKPCADAARWHGPR